MSSSKIKEVGLFEAKTHLSEIAAQVEQGQTFYLTRRGKRLAEIRPISTPKRPLRPGSGKNAKAWIAEDFDAPLEELKDYME